MLYSCACVCLQIVRDLLRDEEAKAACDQYIAERASKGLRSLGVAVSHDDGTSWELAGLISLLDPPRSDSAETIKQAQAMGVQVRRAEQHLPSTYCFHGVCFSLLELNTTSS